MKKISIIVPMFNSELTIERCLTSIINQTYKNLEIILIDDGSADNTHLICTKWAEIDNRIKLYKQKNSGPSATRNFGISKATGEYIQFVDSDDWLVDCASELLIKNMEEGIGQVICGFNITKNGKIIRTPHLSEKIWDIKNSYEDFVQIQKIFASPCNKMYKKKFIKKYFDTTLEMGEDYKFNLNYLEEVDKIKSIPQCLYNVSLDNENSLNRKFNIKRLDLYLSNQVLIEEFCKKNYGEDFSKALIYTNILLATHAHLREISSRDFSYKEKINLISGYIKYPQVIEASKFAKLDRKDYKIFAKLLWTKKPLLVLTFFNVKFKLRILSNKSLT